MAVPLAVAGVATLVAVLLARLFYVLLLRVGRPLPKRKPGQGMHTLIVLGSACFAPVGATGGHTAEILNLLAALDLKAKYFPRSYIAGATDKMSLKRAETFEKDQVGSTSGVAYHSIYRSREVGQSYLTSVLTTLAALAHATWIVAYIRPELVLGIRDVVLVYVESVARVEKLSLTGLILHKLRIADQFIVQWPNLVQKYPGTLYIARLM